MKMNLYKRPYFQMFSAVCDIIEILERLVIDEKISLETKLVLLEETEKLKRLQCLAEEMIMQD